MKIIACVDNQLGLMFHNRRQSQDKILREKIKEITDNLCMNNYSYQLYQDVFPNAQVKEICDDDYYLVENISVKKYENDIDEIILFYWNRDYPADFYLDIDLNLFHCFYEEDFVGSSHEKITLKNIRGKIMKKRDKQKLIKATVSLAIIIGGYVVSQIEKESIKVEHALSVEDIPEYTNKPYVEINDNIPFFDKDNLPTKSFEEYSELDELGRCGVAYANVSIKTMPTKKRGSIGQVKPSGWQTKKYDFVDGKYLYNRCHLLGYQLTGENANERNLITGTRYMNTQGMLPFENMVADYVKETKNHVLYRVTPIFEENDLVAKGVLMEAMSVEDEGLDIEFNVFVYNVQPKVQIDYATGKSKLVK